MIRTVRCEEWKTKVPKGPTSLPMAGGFFMTSATWKAHQRVLRKFSLKPWRLSLRTWCFCWVLRDQWALASWRRRWKQRGCMDSQDCPCQSLTRMKHQQETKLGCSLERRKLAVQDEARPRPHWAFDRFQVSPLSASFQGTFGEEQHAQIFHFRKSFWLQCGEWSGSRPEEHWETR